MTVLVCRTADIPVVGSFSFAGNGNIVSRFGFQIFGFIPVNGYIFYELEGIHEAFIVFRYVGSHFTVKRNTADILFGSAGVGEPLAFSSLRSKLQNQCSSVLGSSLRYISGLTVDTRQGTLYYQYKSEGDTGKGVGTGEQYYADPSLGQMSLSELYFVPKPDFSGTAVIHYTGYASGSSFFQGTIEVTVEEWLISKENFMQSSASWLNMLKLKFSVGQQGNDNIGAYAYTDLYDLNTEEPYEERDAFL